MKTAIAIGLLACAAISGAHAAGFDCSKASTNIERRICANPKLDALDTELNSLYKELRSKAAVYPSIKESQVQWIRNERNVAGSEEALIRAYEYRIMDLKNFQAEQKAREEVAKIEATKPAVKPEVKRVEQPKVDPEVMKEIKSAASMIATTLLCEKSGYMYETKEFRDQTLERTKTKLGSKYDSELMKTTYKKELEKTNLVAAVSPGDFMQFCAFIESSRNAIEADNETDDMDF